MATFTTPGVYVQEISTLPPSVAPVPTSIPVFIGYTEKAERNGVTNALLNKPTRIETFFDFNTIFGGPNVETFSVVLSGPNVDIQPVLDETTPGLDFRLYYHMQMYFANGGSTCYIISVGDYSSPITSAEMQDAIALAEGVDEITMVVIPEAVSSGVTDAEQKALYDAMLTHCSNMQDRFSILDVKEKGISIADDAEQFRNFNVGANNLSYGAAYYPSFAPTLSLSYDAATTVEIDAGSPNLPANIQLYDTQKLSFLTTGSAASGGSIEVVNITYTAGDTLTIGSLPDIDLTTITGGTPAAFATSLATFLSTTPPYNSVLVAEAILDTVMLMAAVNGSMGNAVLSTTATAGDLILTDITGGINPDGALYNRIVTALDAYPIKLYPAATMAGVYTSVDSNRGVWKAPANLSLTMVSSLNVAINDSAQEGLNVDATSGKSIDALRFFPGRGILVWGARTLDGNSNEWRYVNVRRTFLFVEDSCKKATEFCVFEPNDKNLWVKVKGTISNFLTNLWRDGALAGSKPEQAFFVNVGLGETMSAQDILEGRLIVQIGMAVVRPAEFIVLQFEHKLQEA